MKFVIAYTDQSWRRQFVAAIRMRRSFIIPLILISTVALFATAAWVFRKQIQFYQQTGHFYPIRQVDRLERPVSVAGWTETELRLADGRKLPVPGFRKLPRKSNALAEATRNGIEIAPDGRIFGLVRIHHWCGNDPVKEHLTRVDISEMMLFCGEGEPVFKLPPEQVFEKSDVAFSECGWRIGEFMSFETWQEYRRFNRDSTE